MKLRSMSLAFILLSCLLMASVSCRVRQTEEGEMPDVDVSSEGGKLPEYDVDAADVDVKPEKREVEVPNVDIGFGEEKAVPPSLGPPPTPTPSTVLPEDPPQ